MGGFDVRMPRRILVDEVITTGTGQATGVTGWTGQGAATRYNSWATPLPPSSSAKVLAATVSSSNAITTVTAGLSNPDYPRAVRICPSTSQTATGNVLVNGTNQFGTTKQDIIALGGAGANVDGAIAFKTITSIVLPISSSGTGTQAAVSVTVGLTNIFGLDRKVASIGSVVSAVKNGTLETTAAVLSATNWTAKFTSAATSSAGALMEIFFIPQDTANI